jgi:fatty-acyl-CoA synthase
VVNPDSGRVVPRDTPGELCTRGYAVMLGYWENRQASDEAIDQAGWTHAGDLATLGTDGYATVVGRIKDPDQRHGDQGRERLPAGGRGVPPPAPAVGDVQVMGVPDRRYGEELRAWVRLREGRQLTDRSSRRRVGAGSRPPRSPATGDSSTSSR